MLRSRLKRPWPGWLGPRVVFSVVTALTLMALVAGPAQAHDKASDKPRTIITTDGEVDDQDSFIRWLLYANEMETLGLVYSSSQWHWKGDGRGTPFTSPTLAGRYGTRTDLRWVGETWMQEFIDLYGQSYATLRKHASGYPSPNQLKSLVRVGNIDFEGEMSRDTPGSDLIKDVLLDHDQRPVYLQIWGGTNTVARALKSIEDEYKGTRRWKSIYEKVSRKAVIYTILDQDVTYNTYVRPNWPNIRVIYNADQFWSFAYRWRNTVPAELQPFLKGPWMSENILNGHGPLLSSYYVWGDGRQIPGDPEHSHGDVANAQAQGRMFDFISEGDSPAYFHLIDTGLRNLEDPTYGGWGGRFTLSPDNPNRWEDLPNTRDYNPFAPSTTSLVLPAAAGDRNIKVASVQHLGRGEPVTVGTGGTAETHTVASVGTAQGPQTSLFAAAPAGATNIKVGSVNGFTVGEKLFVDTGANVETPTVTAIGTPGVTTNLDGAHAPGTSTIKVLSVAGLEVGDTLTINNGANTETATVTSVGTATAVGTGVGVAPALTRAHNHNTIVRNQSEPGTGITFTPALGNAHGMNSAARGVGTGVILEDPLQNAHAAGTTVATNYNTTYPQTRWVEDIQNDWAARADWMVKPYKDANHPPRTWTWHKDRVARPGERVTLFGGASDPDGDGVRFRWWQYHEADSYAGQVDISGADRRLASFVVPPDAKRGDAIHVIMEVEDSGTPTLTRYERVIVTVGKSKWRHGRH